MAKLIHMMVRVTDEARSVKFYESCFGLTVSGRYDWPDFTLIYMKNSETDFEIELTVNKGQDGSYDHGTGYGHVAFAVDDIQAVHDRITAAGYAPKDIKAMQRDGQPFATFFFIEDPDGYKIEILERSGRFA